MEELNEQNYYTLEMDRKYCSASQFLSFIGRPFMPGCEARTMAMLNGEWEQETTKAMLTGSILDAMWEGLRGEEFANKFPDCVLTKDYKGRKKGELKSEYIKCIDLYERTYRDEKFRAYMSGEKQVIMTGEIEGLPFKIKMDSFIPGKCITDLKTTENTSKYHRKYVADIGETLSFVRGWNYDVQLSIYREIVRQNTGDTLPCYIAAVDKKEHPLPVIIQIDDKDLDDALDHVKRNCDKIIRLKSGELEPLRCDQDGCNYCRDTYECKVMSLSEFEAHDE